jgi:hypothetical protein
MKYIKVEFDESTKLQKSLKSKAFRATGKITLFQNYKYITKKQDYL